ncbi:MAG TPA: RNA 2',3'-cyclic phosphodiesterase [Thermomicrobiales bacterium]|nr:RNA 2',3'-cyclic phosphodiesterase [Thermomicrobiales bacterium]
MKRPTSPSPRDRSTQEDAVDTRWRLFLAVPLPDGVRETVAHEINALAREDWPVRWVNPEGAHLTLHFLGEVAPERAELLRLGLPPVVARHTAFDLRTSHLGVFPNLRRPRVIWLGLYGPAHRLETLQRDLGATLRELGFPVGDEPFQPHITLVRVRNTGTPRMPLRALPDAIRRRIFDDARNEFIGPASQPLPVREAHLVRSHLGQDGARYETIARFPLAPREDRAS